MAQRSLSTLWFCGMLLSMKTVTIEELDGKTGQWLRDAVHHEQVVVTDHGLPIVTVSPYPNPARPANGGGFRNRVLLPEYEAIMNQPVAGTDSSEIISEDREDRW